MSTVTVCSQTFYISSGAKNAMYTLRYRRIGDGMPFEVDNYVCNLSTDAEKAERKAREYFDVWKDRVGETSHFKINFAGYADFDLYERRSTFSVYQTDMLERLENGIMPIGKHQGKNISDLPASTVLWYADQANNKASGDSSYDKNKANFFNAVCAIMLGYALEFGYIEKREQRRKEIEERGARSKFIGSEKERLDFNGTLVVCKEVSTIQIAYNKWSIKYINIIECGDDVVVYFGNPLGDVGSEISFKATVKEHNERNGVKQTVVQRPKVY